MELSSFHIRNYRSIRKADLSLGALTVLVGPNNEGKSNIIRALALGLYVLSGRSAVSFAPGRRLYARSPAEAALKYDPSRDLPNTPTGRAQPAYTVLRYGFRFTPLEIAEFKAAVRSELNGQLAVQLRFGSERPTFTIVKQGPGQQHLTEKHQAIRSFLEQHLHFNHIPAVRPSETTVRLVEDLVRQRLADLDDNPDYQAALVEVGRLQQPILRDLEETIATGLRLFLPDVTHVKIELEDRSVALRESVDVRVDDGTSTNLALKGDGVQSLAAISLVHHFAQAADSTTSLILSVEEPESHLHPGAVHRLRDVLMDISVRQQVILTTHSPLLVNMHMVSSNVIVHGGRARTAQSVQEIRSVLGVRTTDNLASAEMVLVVEGTNDQRGLQVYLPSASPILAEALRSGRLQIHPLHGVSSLSYMVNFMRFQLTGVHALVDNDVAGLASIRGAQAQGLLSDEEVNTTACLGMKESEFEDLVRIEAYAPLVRDAFAVDLDKGSFRKRRGSWSVRMGKQFHGAGCDWTDGTKLRIKGLVSDAIESIGPTAFDEHYVESLNTTVARLEKRLGNLKRR